ncbi:hypothetical protein [Herpetosiphon giganteus]|uniref:hypothetical protein n=1 Tax=Herpetosiphon giganteus TaxID=2029754 RepID=UPI00195E9074|nr:hypothetical protein [Herpetosiphon giganteus]MBM7845692.1 hypothetical protein [Herpetosiphon giganteus]
MLDLFAIIRDALLHPTQLLLNLHRQRYRYRQLGLALALWLGFWLVTIGVGLLLMLDTPPLLFGISLLLPQLFLVVICALAIVMGTSNAFRYRVADGLYLSEPVFLQRSYYAFWPLRMQLAWVPAFFGLSTVMLQFLQTNDPRLLMLFLIVTGCALGSLFVTTHIALPTMLTTRIWLGLMLLWMQFGLIPMIGTLWFSLAFFALGLWIGIVRPISWLWQSLVSIGIGCLVRFSGQPWRWWRYHPALYDELALLPLIGLSWSLRQLYQLDPARGFKALIAVYRLSAQRPAVRRTIQQLLHDQRSSASVFWQLSSDQHGILLLHQLNRRARSLHPLINHMTACSQIAEPQAWPLLIAKMQPALKAYATNPAFRQLSACLELIATILTCSEAQPAYAALQRYPAEAQSLLEQAISELQANAQRAPDQPHLLPPTGALLRGWPRHALLSTIEQLNFLQKQAKQQG